MRLLRLSHELPNAATKNALTTEIIGGEGAPARPSPSQARSGKPLPSGSGSFSRLESRQRSYLLKTPAGSIRVTLRMAVMAAKMHMPTVSANRYAAIFGVMTMVNVGTRTESL